MNSLFNLARMTCHDFLFYASRDYGASARPVSTIGNYALMYAMNRNIPEVRRVITGTTPKYNEHLPLMKVYATPASPVSAESVRGDPQIGAGIVDFVSSHEVTRITWNSVGESLLWAMEAEKINIPKVGSYFKINPLATFYFYTVGGPIPSVIRIGKKYIPARIRLEALEITEKEGRFKPTCAVNVEDLPEETQILGGSLLTVPPSPLLLDADLDGAYVEGKAPDGSVHRIPVPRQDRFRESWPLE
ncbi:MAG: type I-D CRISPR-associated protein Cas5/Csc1 [Candidatus Thorarchaeota archaeon]|nr:MAG: type I-D CRISPR-associated protein Cas5/Csc1 [Candidatus Thorarchaeota archaeon]